MDRHGHLALCSFNCRSIKSSVSEVRSLCDIYDFVCIQEHWLLSIELNIRLVVLESGLGLESGLKSFFAGLGLGLWL